MDLSGVWSVLHDLRIVSVTVHTLDRAVLVNNDLLFTNHFGLSMAFRASDIRVATRQRKMRFVMVKSRRSPALGVVAIDTVSLAVLGQELPVMSVVVAGFTLHGCALESLIRVACCLMALSARYPTMCAQKRELGLRVIKLLVDGLEIDPLPAACVVAG